MNLLKSNEHLLNHKCLSYEGSDFKNHIVSLLYTILHFTNRAFAIYNMKIGCLYYIPTKTRVIIV